MSPLFVFLVILGCIAVWFLLSGLFEPIGRLFYRIFKDTHTAMNSGEEINFLNEKENEDEQSR